MKKGPHTCRCPDCGATHIPPKLPLASCCDVCLNWLPVGSKGKYCSAECRKEARVQRARQAPPANRQSA